MDFSEIVVLVVILGVLKYLVIGYFVYRLGYFRGSKKK